MLAIMEADDLAHGPLEFLFTIDEETGLTGAGGLAEGVLEGSRLINLDSEEEGVLTIGCAGGADSHLHLGVERAAVKEGSAAISVRVAGLKGGHSGVDIHLQRGNAIKILARALHAASLEEPIRIASFGGGNAHNAIPREVSATLVVPAADGIPQTVKEAVESELDAARMELRAVDPGMSFTIEDAPIPADALTARRHPQTPVSPDGSAARGDGDEQRHRGSGGDQHEPRRGARAGRTRVRADEQPELRDVGARCAQAADPLFR